MGEFYHLITWLLAFPTVDLELSLNFTLYYHVLSLALPLNERAGCMKLGTVSDPLCSPLGAQQCQDRENDFTWKELISVNVIRDDRLTTFE